MYILIYVFSLKDSRECRFSSLPENYKEKKQTIYRYVGALLCSEAPGKGLEAERNMISEIEDESDIPLSKTTGRMRNYFLSPSKAKKVRCSKKYRNNSYSVFVKCHFSMTLSYKFSCVTHHSVGVGTRQPLISR